jgi:hypothetical protein
VQRGQLKQNELLCNSSSSERPTIKVIKLPQTSYCYPALFVPKLLFTFTCLVIILPDSTYRQACSVQHTSSFVTLSTPGRAEYSYDVGESGSAEGLAFLTSHQETEKLLYGFKRKKDFNGGIEFHQVTRLEDRALSPLPEKREQTAPCFLQCR